MDKCLFETYFSSTLKDAKEGNEQHFDPVLNIIWHKSLNQGSE